MVGELVLEKQSNYIAALVAGTISILSLIGSGSLEVVDWLAMPLC